MSSEYIQIGWARINDRGDIYDLRLHKPMSESLIELYIKNPTLQDKESISDKKLTQ